MAADRAEVITDPPPRPDPEPGACVFAWGVWLAMTAAAVGLVLRFGPQVPVGDDYAIVPTLTGEEPVTPSWLWSLHNEHRLPLPRLALLGAYPLSGYDFRAGMFATVACLSALAAALIRASSRVRGGCSYADAVFPILLLNWGHSANLLWSWQIQFGLSTLLAGLAAALIASRSNRAGPWLPAALGVLLLLLPLCGANGLAMVPPLAIWLIGLGVHRMRRDRSGGRLAFAAVLPGLVLTVLYFVDYERPPQIDRAPGPMAVLRTALQVLAVGLGPVAGEAWRVIGGVLLALATATSVLLLATARRRPMERLRALGLLAALAGFGLLTLGLAWGRAGGNERAGLEPRYVTLTAPVPCLVALVWSLYGPIALRRLVTMGLLTGACVLLWPNMRSGLESAATRRSKSDAVIADIRSGVPTFALIARHSGVLLPSHEELSRLLPMLARARMGAFRELEPDPPLREIPLTEVPIALSLARWDPDTRTIEATGVDPWATFSLPERTWVAGLRIRYDHDNGTDSSARFKLAWRRSDQAGFPPDQQHERWGLATGEGRSLLVWIAAPIDSFRIQPDNKASRFRIEELTLLVP